MVTVSLLAQPLAESEARSPINYRYIQPLKKGNFKKDIQNE